MISDTQGYIIVLLLLLDTYIIFSATMGLFYASSPKSVIDATNDLEKLCRFVFKPIKYVLHNIQNRHNIVIPKRQKLVEPKIIQPFIPQPLPEIENPNEDCEWQRNFENGFYYRVFIKPNFTSYDKYYPAEYANQYYQKSARIIRGLTSRQG